MSDDLQISIEDPDGLDEMLRALGITATDRAHLILCVADDWTPDGWRRFIESARPVADDLNHHAPDMADRFHDFLDAIELAVELPPDLRKQAGGPTIRLP